MSNWLGRWFGYGVGVAAGKAIFGTDGKPKSASQEPIRQMTEAEILADEKRFAEDEKRLDRESPKP
jgi:hypothetical protein